MAIDSKKHLVLFELQGELAMWRHVEDAKGAFSCLGPAPSSIAGICGSAMGMISPLSPGFAQKEEDVTVEAKSMSGARNKPDSLAKKKKDRYVNRTLWPVSPDLLRWQSVNDYHVACALLNNPRRKAYNLNGLKHAQEWGNLRMQQSIILDPHYLVAVSLSSQAAAGFLVEALRVPKFKIYLGATFCPGWISGVTLASSLPDRNDISFARVTEDLGRFDTIPLTKHVIGGFPRILSEGYWAYDGEAGGGLVCGYIDRPSNE